MAPPASPVTLPAGERRTLVDVLIENARLLAELDGKEELINEIRDDKKFLKTELSKRDDAGIKELAGQMLQTLQTMATGRRIEAAAPQPMAAEIIRPQ